MKYHDLGPDFHCSALWAQSGGVPKRHLLLTDPSVPHQQHSRENPELQDFGLPETLFLEYIEWQKVSVMSVSYCFFKWMKKNPSQKKQTKKQIQPLEILFKKNPRWNLVGGGWTSTRKLPSRWLGPTPARGTQKTLVGAECWGSSFSQFNPGCCTPFRRSLKTSPISPKDFSKILSQPSVKNLQKLEDTIAICQIKCPVSKKKNLQIFRDPQIQPFVFFLGRIKVRRPAPPRLWDL